MFPEILLKLLKQPAPLVEGQWNNISFAVPILVDISQPLSLLHIFIYSTEAVLTCFGMLMMIYFAHFIRGGAIFHYNLKYMLTVWTGFYIFSSISRFYLMMVEFQVFTDLSSPFFLIAGIVRMNHFGISLCAILSIAMERSFATYYVLDYEKKERPWVGHLCFFTSFVYTQFFVIPITFFQAPLIYIVFYASLSTIIAKIVLISLYYLNRRELKMLDWQFRKIGPMKNVKYTLSKKFQLEENIKITGYLRWFGVMIVILVIFLLIFIVMPIIYFGIDTYIGQIMMSLFDLDLAIAAIVVPTLSLLFIRKSRPLPLPSNLEWINIKRRESKRVVPVISVHVEANVYFDQLHKSWE